VDVFTYGDHRSFVAVEGWEIVGDRGGHVNYVLKVTQSRAVLRTGISQGADSTEYYDPHLRSMIVRHQLKVTPAEFWACVNDGKAPERRSDGSSVGVGGREGHAPPRQDPALLGELQREFGESPAEVEGMSDVELRAYLTLLWDRRARGEAAGGQNIP